MTLRGCFDPFLANRHAMLVFENIEITKRGEIYDLNLDFLKALFRWTGGPKIRWITIVFESPYGLILRLSLPL